MNSDSVASFVYGLKSLKHAVGEGARLAQLGETQNSIFAIRAPIELPTATGTSNSHNKEGPIVRECASDSCAIAH